MSSSKPHWSLDVLALRATGPQQRAPTDVAANLVSRKAADG